MNLPEHRLYYYPKPEGHDKPVVITYPVSIGKMDWRTPLGETHVIAKIKNPAWYPPESVRKEHLANDDPLPKVVPAGPDNPLGDFAMRLAAGGGSYMIHGTNNPTAVGMSVTHGCIRMYPEDVAAVFAAVPVGTKVRLINEPVKVAWVHGQLLLEVHPPVDAEGQSGDDGPSPAAGRAGPEGAVEDARSGTASTSTPASSGSWRARRSRTPPGCRRWSVWRRALTERPRRSPARSSRNRR